MNPYQAAWIPDVDSDGEEIDYEENSSKLFLKARKEQREKEKKNRGVSCSQIRKKKNEKIGIGF